MLSLRSAIVAVTVAGFAAPILAADPATITTRVAVIRPATTSPVKMRHLKRRLADAALEACGASGFSLAEMKAAAARSRCWQDAYAGAIVQIDRGGVRSADASLSTTADRGRP